MTFPVNRYYPKDFAWQIYADDRISQPSSVVDTVVKYHVFRDFTTPIFSDTKRAPPQRRNAVVGPVCLCLLDAMTFGCTGQFRPFQLSLGILLSKVGIDILRVNDLGIPHQILQGFRHHAGAGHVAAVCMATDMGCDLRQLDPIDFVILSDRP